MHKTAPGSQTESTLIRTQGLPMSGDLTQQKWKNEYNEYNEIQWI